MDLIDMRVPMMPANVPKIRYKVPTSLWLVEYIQRVKN
jgi:hypothetical protein